MFPQGVRVTSEIWRTGTNGRNESVAETHGNQGPFRGIDRGLQAVNKLILVSLADESCIDWVQLQLCQIHGGIFLTRTLSKYDPMALPLPMFRRACMILGNERYPWHPQWFPSSGAFRMQPSGTTSSSNRRSRPHCRSRHPLKDVEMFCRTMFNKSQCCKKWEGRGFLKTLVLKKSSDFMGATRNLFFLSPHLLSNSHFPRPKPMLPNR